MSIAARVSRHYGYGSVSATVLDAVDAAGLDRTRLSPRELAPVDEFHTRGRSATEELVSALGLRADMHVLDVGSGLGGPARHVVDAVGCRVSGLDLVDEYVDLATALAGACGLDGQLDFRQGDANAMPFADAAFDAAYTQHACMNIPDKRGVYSEVRRLLRPGGAFGIYDVMQGPGGSPFFPCPWATDQGTSFLATPRETREHLRAAGFEILSQHDRTDACEDWFTEVQSRPVAAGSPGLGIHLLLGERFPAIATNLLRNLRERRIVAVQFVCVAPH